MQHITMTIYLLLIITLLQSIKASSFLQVRETQKYSFVTNDIGSKSKKDGSFWKPQLKEGESFISFVNALDYGEPMDVISLIITDYPPNALKEPIGSKLIWEDAGSKGDYDIKFFKPIAPIDYQCLGDFVSQKSAPITLWGGYKCIHEDYINILDESSVQQKLMWDDKGSGAKTNGQVVEIKISGGSGYPQQYFLTRKDYGEVEGPFYSINTFPRNCDVINVSPNIDVTKQILTGIVDHASTITFSNGAMDYRTTKSLSQNICKSSTSSFTHTAGGKVGMKMTYGFEATEKIDIDIASSSVTEKFGLEISAEFYSEWKEEEINTFKTCTTYPEEEVECPGRTICTRQYMVFTAPNTNIPISITVQCGSQGKEIIEGTFKATGAASILVKDTQIPMDCKYYTNEYSDRGNGSLAFCDTCNHPNKCDICRDYMVWIRGECYDDKICTRKCNGKIESPSQTVPHSTKPDFAGRYCVGEQLTFKNCSKYFKHTY